jgi:hypothetical protein
MNDNTLKSKPINADRIGFFFGAGASMEFGIPSMKEMTRVFIQELRMKEEKRAFSVIYRSLAKIYNGNVDLEAVMSVISALKEKERARDNISELGLFILEKKGILIKQIKAQFKYNISVLNNLESRFKKHVRKKVVNRNSRKIDLGRKVYFDFFKQICANCTNCTNVQKPDGDPSKYTHDSWTFFTTNYDNTIEDFWVKSRGYFLLDLGFELKQGKRVMNAENFIINNSSNNVTAMQLIKLHGSVNWIRNRDRDIEQVEYNMNYDDIKKRTGSSEILEDMMIYPLSQKQLYFTPYIQLFRILEAELKKRDCWIIIGYSFRDIVIRTMFERALEEDPNRKILLVHPHATTQIKPLFVSNRKHQVMCLDVYFGRNYENVNKEIAKALLDLANT